MVELRPVVKDNYNACIALEVAPDQRGFVAANLYTLAQAYIYRDTARLYALYADGALVGLSMLNVDCARDNCWLWRLMIDRRFQRRGYGRAALLQIMDVFASAGARRVRLSLDKENAAARALYRSCGFCENGALLDGEIVMERAL